MRFVDVSVLNILYLVFSSAYLHTWNPTLYLQKFSEHFNTLHDTQTGAVVLIFTGGAEAFRISYPVLITEVTRPRRSDGCRFRRSLA